MNKSKTPVCPGCGAKFSHDNTTGTCSRCGLPDGVIHRGPRAIARWKRKPTKWTTTAGGVAVQVADPASKRERKRRLHRHPARKQRNRHGRIGGGRR